MNSSISTLFAESLNKLDISTKQKAVLRASLTLFSEKGFENTSTSDIARMADVAEGTVYKQFRTKEELLRAIVDPVIIEVIPKVSGEFINSIGDKESSNFTVFLQKIIQNRLQFVVDNLPQLKILVREAMVNTEIRKHIQSKFEEGPLDKLKEFFEYSQKQGQLVNWDFMRILRYIAGTLAGYLIPTIFIANTTINVTQVSQEATEFLIKGLAP